MIGIKCLASLKLLTGSQIGRELTPLIGCCCCLAKKTGWGHDQFANVLKNKFSSIDAFAFGFSLHTQHTKMAQLKQQKKDGK